MSIDPEYVRLSAQVETQRAQIDALAVKLRDVTAALVEADGAILSRLNNVVGWAHLPAVGYEDDPSATQPAPPEGYEETLNYLESLERIRLSPWQWIKDKLGLPIF